MSGLGTSTAKSYRHEWPLDTLKAVALNAHVEGADATYPDRTDPTRGNNYCQIIRVGFHVSDTEREVDHAGFADRFTYETAKAMKEWKNDCEYALLRGTLVCGNNSTARYMMGIIHFVDTNNATSQSGTSLSETELNRNFQLVWDDGADVDEMYGGAYMKRKISGFTAGSTLNLDREDRRLVNAVDVYESDFGITKLFKHRYVTVSGDTNYDIVGIDSEYKKIAYLRKPIMRELAKTGDSTKGEIVGELTLEDRATKAGFWSSQML